MIGMNEEALFRIENALRAQRNQRLPVARLQVDVAPKPRVGSNMVRIEPNDTLLRPATRDITDAETIRPYGEQPAKSGPRMAKWYILGMGLILGGMYLASLDKPSVPSDSIARAIPPSEAASQGPASLSDVSQSHAGIMVAAAGATAPASAPDPVAPISESGPSAATLAAASAPTDPGAKAAPHTHEMPAQARAQSSGGTNARSHWQDLRYSRPAFRCRIRAWCKY